MQRASSEAQFNVVGDELRKIEAHLKTFAELCVGMEKSRQEDIGKLPTEDGMSKGFAHLEGEIMLRSIDFEHNLSNALRQMEERLKQGQESLAKRIEFMATQLQQNQQLIMQKLASNGVAIECCVGQLTVLCRDFYELKKLSKKRQPKPVGDVAEFDKPIVGSDGAAQTGWRVAPERGQSKKRQPKPVRPASKRKSTRKP